MVPSAVQVSPAVGTDRYGMLHPPGRSHALAGEAMAARLLGSFFSGTCRLECG